MHTVSRRGTAMPLNKRAKFLVCYDIADPRRLSRVHRCIKQRGLPMQYSVFMAIMSPRQLDALLCELADIVHPGQDDVRAYRLPPRPDIVYIGPEPLPEGVMLHDGVDVGDVDSSDTDDQVDQ